MSGRTALIVCLALVFGGSAAVGVARLAQAPRVAADVETVGVVVAAKDVPRYTTITAEMLRVQQVSKNLVPPGAATKVEDVVDRVSDSPLIKDEPVLEGKLAGKGSGRGMGAVIPKGMRAVTIQTPNVATGVAGFILPGSKVDVLFTHRNGNPNDPSGGGLSRTLVQHVEILAVDQRIDAPAENKVDAKELRSVTLLVTPDQATEIDLAQHAGTLHLTLRNPSDSEPTPAGTATLSGIQGVKAPAPQPAAPPQDDRMKELVERMEKMLAELAAKKAKTDATPEPVAVAPPPTPKPEVPEAPPKIRTLRAGIPGQVYIE